MEHVFTKHDGIELNRNVWLLVYVWFKQEQETWYITLYLYYIYIYVYDVERPSFIGNWKIINTMKKTNQKNKITTPIKTTPKKQKQNRNNKK